MPEATTPEEQDQEPVESPPTAPPSDSPSLSGMNRKRLLTLSPIALGVILGLVVIVVIIILALGTFTGPRQSDGIPLEVTRLSPSSPIIPPSAPVIEIGDTEMALAVPTLLKIGQQSFSVQASDPGEEISPPSSESATWVYGTVINYVLALEPAAEIQEMVEGLSQGDPITLHLSNGTQLTFHAQEHQQMEANDPAIFSQSRPGLTLVVLTPGEEWLVLTTDFEAAVEATPVAGGVTAEVGQGVQVGDARITVLEGHTQREEDLPQGTMLYLVEFSITNTGAGPLSPEGFLMELQDGLGNRYLPTPTASAAGAYGPLSGAIEPGQETEGSVGYVVPATLSGPTLTWIFSPRAGSELRARVSIPYTQEPVPTSEPEVDVQDAFLGEGGANLHIVAQIRNQGQAPLTVTADDVSLSSSTGPGELQMAAPPLPWTIAPEDTQIVELQFARPEASSCAVDILGFTFEISGLP